MMHIPNDARLELTGLRLLCEGNNISYADAVWAARYPEPPKPSSKEGWPYRPARDLPANVTPIKTRRK